MLQHICMFSVTHTVVNNKGMASTAFLKVYQRSNILHLLLIFLPSMLYFYHQCKNWSDVMAVTTRWRRELENNLINFWGVSAATTPRRVKYWGCIMQIETYRKHDDFALRWWFVRAAWSKFLYSNGKIVRMCFVKVSSVTFIQLKCNT